MIRTKLGPTFGSFPLLRIQKVNLTGERFARFTNLNLRRRLQGSIGVVIEKKRSVNRLNQWDRPAVNIDDDNQPGAHGLGIEDLFGTKKKSKS